MSAQPQPIEPNGYRETPSMILPAGVPAELSIAIAAAARRVDALDATGRELHFDVDGTGELVVQMRDRHGNLLKALSPTQAVSLMGGLGQV